MLLMVVLICYANLRNRTPGVDKGEKGGFHSAIDVLDPLLCMRLQCFFSIIINTIVDEVILPFSGLR